MTDPSVPDAEVESGDEEPEYSYPIPEQKSADEIAEEFYSTREIGGDSYLAELWVGRWTTEHGRPVLITAGRAHDTKYFVTLGFDISPGVQFGGLEISDTIHEPNPWKYEHGLVLIGGEEADSLNAAWQDSLSLSAQWGGLSRHI